MKIASGDLRGGSMGKGGDGQRREDGERGGRDESGAGEWGRGEFILVFPCYFADFRVPRGAGLPVSDGENCTRHDSGYNGGCKDSLLLSAGVLILPSPGLHERVSGMSTSPKNACWVGFDLGGTKMLATLFDSSFQPLGRRRAKTQAFKGAEKGMDRLKKSIRTVIEEAEVDRKSLGGIGVGCPGPLDLDRGVLIESPNLSWRNVAVKEALEDEFGCPAVIVNDVDAGVYGEYRFGAAQSARCVVGVFPGTGIGGGCVYQGRILRGKTGSCMEVGHLRVMPDGPRCGCGQRGCLEAVASRLAISAAAAQAVYRGQAPHLCEAVGSDLGEIRSGALAESIREGDTVVEQIVRDACGHLGTAVASVVHLLAPDVVVLGGGLVEAMPDLFTEAVGAAARQRVMPSFAQSFEVVAAKLGDDAAVMGAAAWAQEVVASKVNC